MICIHCEHEGEFMKKTQTIINGIIVPSEWNEKGEIQNIAIVTFDEDTFLIADNNKARVLMNSLRKTVTLSGKVTMNGTQKEIHISKFQIHDL
jgi:hypothetical protein